MIVHVGDRVLLHSYALYLGETIPEIPESDYTGVIEESWGRYQYFYKLKRDHDGRLYPIMHKDIQAITERKREKANGRTKKSSK